MSRDEEGVLKAPEKSALSSSIPSSICVHRRSSVVEFLKPRPPLRNCLFLCVPRRPLRHSGYLLHPSNHERHENPRNNQNLQSLRPSSHSLLFREISWVSWFPFSRPSSHHRLRTPNPIGPIGPSPCDSASSPATNPASAATGRCVNNFTNQPPLT